VNKYPDFFIAKVYAFITVSGSHSLITKISFRLLIMGRRTKDDYFLFCGQSFNPETKILQKNTENNGF